MAQAVFVDKNYTKGLTAIRHLEETLSAANPAKPILLASTNDRTITIDRAIRHLSDEFRRMSLREVVASGAEGAVAKLLSVVLDAAVPNLIGRQVVPVYTGVTPSIRIPKAAVAKAYFVGEEGGAVISGEKYTYTEIVARLAECIPLVTRSEVEDCSWDVIERQYAEGARALSDLETQTVLTGIIAGQAGGTAAAATKLVSGVITGIQTLAGNNRNADTIICHPVEYGELLKDATAGYYWIPQWSGGQAPMITGVIPEIAGCKLLRSSRQTSGTISIIDSKRAGALYIRRDITIEDYADPIKDLAGAVLTERFNYATIDGTAIYTYTD